MGNKYIFNKHIAPITANARDRNGAILFTKVFQPERIDGTTGRIVSTGYTTLTDEEYEKLCKGSRTFQHYIDKLKLLSVCEDLPPEAKTPQEALVDARRKEREAQGKISVLEAEITGLKVKLLDAENAVKTLSSASTDAEKLKPLNDEIARLKIDLGVAKTTAEQAVKLAEDIKVLEVENEKLKAASQKAGTKEKDFE